MTDLDDLAHRVRVLRERAYVAAPMDDLHSPLHDICGELVGLDHELERAAVRCRSMDGDIDDLHGDVRERDRDIEALKAILRRAVPLLEEQDRKESDELVEDMQDWLR